jgi:predicted aspartyl protease
LSVTLSSAVETIEFLAYVDTGASHCLFEREHAEILGLDVEAGEPMVFRTATGGVEAFGHMVELEVLDIRFESMVYFFRDPGIRRNLLGRSGWLDRVRLGIVDYDSTVYIAPYDFDPWLSY